MNTSERIRVAEVTLGPGALAAAKRFGITENELRLARAFNTSEHPQPQYLVAIGQLADGRRVQMSCLHDTPGHIVSVRLT